MYASVFHYHGSLELDYQREFDPLTKVSGWC